MSFYFELEKNIIEIRKEFMNDVYRCGEYKQFKIYDPKERIISVSSFKDRVVHHAIVNLIEPVYEKVFIYHSYACRKNKGTHKAVFKAQEYLRQSRFFLKCDISKFFYSVKHFILEDILVKKIKDSKFMEVVHEVICSYGDNEGLPIGNVTSQFFGNIYLNPLDYFIKEKLLTKKYLRYMDDFVLFSDDKDELKNKMEKIRCFVERDLSLQLKSDATFINKKENGLSFLGTRIYSNNIRIKKSNLKRSVRKIKYNENSFLTGKIDEKELYMKNNSIISHFCKYNTYELRRNLFG